MHLKMIIDKADGELRELAHKPCWDEDDIWQIKTLLKIMHYADEVMEDKKEDCKEKLSFDYLVHHDKPGMPGTEAKPM